LSDPGATYGRNGSRIQSVGYDAATNTAYVPDQTVDAVFAIDLADGSERLDRADLDDTGGDPRAPSAVALRDGEPVVCGFLDGELRPWSTDPVGYGDPIGPCLTGAAVLGDGTLVTATADGLVAIDR
jgi:hypothetical protein